MDPNSKRQPRAQVKGRVPQYDSAEVTLLLALLLVTLAAPASEPPVAHLESHRLRSRAVSVGTVSAVSVSARWTASPGRHRAAWRRW